MTEIYLNYVGTLTYYLALCIDISYYFCIIKNVQAWFLPDIAAMSAQVAMSKYTGALGNGRLFMLHCNL